jgi:hypothetical protein
VVSKRPWFLSPCENISEFLRIEPAIYSHNPCSTIHPCFFIDDINKKDKKAVKIMSKEANKTYHQKLEIEHEINI